MCLSGHRKYPFGAADEAVRRRSVETVPGKFREIPFLTGHVNFPRVIRAAWSLGVRRCVIEMWDAGKPGWQDDIRFARSAMVKILDAMTEEAGV